jgi:serine/threonine protein kinase
MSAAAGPVYRLHQALGAGGMGVVHLGTQVSAAGERLVAIKRLAGRTEVDAAARARLVAEARLVFQLTYANICQVLDLGENEAGTFVVMEYVRGDDLDGLLEQVEAGGGRLDPAASVYVAREVARALDYAHRRLDATGRPLGLVHGDVKPPNILISVEGEVKLADFGIARALGAAAPGTGILGGTPWFMAPETRAGGLDHRADIYSLGATLLRALLGRRGEGDAPSLAELERAPEVPRDLRDIVARALATERGARWLSAAELERALSAWLARRHPEFTPSLLAEVVRRHVRAQDVRLRPGAATPEGATEIFDMHTLLDDGEGAGEPTRTTAPVAPAPERMRTATAAAPPRSWWSRVLQPWPVLGLLTIAMAVALIARTRPVSPGARLAAPDASVATAGPPIDAGRVAATEVAPAPAPAPVHAPAPTPRREGRTPAPRVAPPPPAPPAETGYLTVNATPWASVFVDGKRVAAETPAYRLPVAAGKHLVVVEFGGDGERSPPQSVTIDAGQQRTLGFRQ